MGLNSQCYSSPGLASATRTGESMSCNRPGRISPYIPRRCYYSHHAEGSRNPALARMVELSLASSLSFGFREKG